MTMPSISRGAGINAQSAYLREVAPFPALPGVCSCPSSIVKAAMTETQDSVRFGSMYVVQGPELEAPHVDFSLCPPTMLLPCRTGFSIIDRE